MRTDINYSPTDCFETFAQPELTETVRTLGGELQAHRSALMLDRQEGLTKTYNRVHDPDDQSRDIARLRELHAPLDYAVRDAYGWTDLNLGHGFHETKFGTRFTFAPASTPGGARPAARAEPRALRGGGRAGAAWQAEGEGQAHDRADGIDGHGAGRCLSPS